MGGQSRTGKPSEVGLRGEGAYVAPFLPWRSSQFHSDGSLAGDAIEGPWTVDGQIAVEQIQLHGGLLEIKGRIYVIIDSKSKPQDALTTLDNYKGEDRKDVEKLLRQQSAVQIEVELPSATPGSDEVASALRAVFALPANP